MPKSSNHNSDVHGVHQMVHSTFQCCNSLLCPNMSNHDDAILGAFGAEYLQFCQTDVHVSLLALCWLHGHSQAQSMQEANAKICSVKLQYNTICLFQCPLLVVFADLFLSDMQRTHTGPLSLSRAVWVSLDKGKWCGDQHIPKQLKQDLNCLKDAQVLPSNAVDGIQSCFEAQVCD